MKLLSGGGGGGGGAGRGHSGRDLSYILNL